MVPVDVSSARAVPVAAAVPARTAATTVSPAASRRIRVVMIWWALLLLLGLFMSMGADPTPVHRVLLRIPAPTCGGEEAVYGRWVTPLGPICRSVGAVSTDQTCECSHRENLHSIFTFAGGLCGV